MGRLQKKTHTKKTLRTNGGRGWDDILSTVPIYSATPSITGLLCKTGYVIHNNESAHYILNKKPAYMTPVENNSTTGAKLWVMVGEA